MYEIDTATVYQIQVIKIHLWEWVLAFNVLVLFLIFYFRKKLIYIEKNPEYKYFVWGFYAKFFSAIGFVSVYYFVYSGGDTFGYFESAMSMANLFYKDPIGYFEVLFSNHSPELFSHFDFFTGYPYAYLVEDPKTFLVIKLVSLIAIITGNSYLLTTIVIAIVTYTGSWRLFQLFYSYYPKISFQLAIAILFFPSVLFWGSSVLKDSFTLMSSCLFVVHYHRVFIKKNKKFSSVFWMIFHGLIVIGIKPYILMVLIPGLLFWTFYERFTLLKSQAIKFVLLPLIIVFSIGFSFFFFKTIANSSDKFSIDNALETASVTQIDLKKDYYEGQSFDIGDFDGTVLGAIRLFPMATFAGMFRPILIEADTPFMLLSALENLYLLFLFARLFLRIRLKRVFKVITGDPLITFCFIYSVFFAFMLGLTTSNYGALIRFKIPMIPFFASGLVIASHYLQPKNYEKFILDRKRKKEEKIQEKTSRI